MKKTKIILFAGIGIFVAGITFQIIIQTFQGSYLELRELWPTFVVIILMASGLVLIGVVIMYEFIVRKYKGRKMKISLIVGIIIGIGIAIIASGFLYQETYNQNCIEGEGKVTGFLKCTRVFVFPEDPNAELKQKIQKLIAEEKKNPTRAGHSFVSIAINSDELTHDEKLQAIEIHTKEGSGKPNTSNVLTGKNLFEDQESITFTWKQYGWGTPCPKIAIQDELRVDQYNREVIYQEEKQSLCPVFLEDSAFFFTFTEEDFPNFPPCSITGQHYISVRNQFDDWFTLHEYWCFSVPDDALTPENIDERLEMTNEFLNNFEFDQATILHTEINYVSKQVVVTIASEEFTEEHTAEYHKENLKNWIPFDTRIVVARGFAE